MSFAMQSAARAAEKSRQRPLREDDRGEAQRSRSSVRPNPFEDAVDAARPDRNDAIMPTRHHPASLDFLRAAKMRLIRAVTWVSPLIATAIDRCTYACAMVTSDRLWDGTSALSHPRIASSCHDESDRACEPGRDRGRGQVRIRISRPFQEPASISEAPSRKRGFGWQCWRSTDEAHIFSRVQHDADGLVAFAGVGMREFVFNLLGRLIVDVTAYGTAKVVVPILSFGSWRVDVRKAG